MIIVDEKGVRPDQTYLNLWKKHLRDLDTQRYGHERIDRRERRVKDWWAKISAGNPAIPPERRDEIMEMLHRAADLYKAGDEKPTVLKVA